MRYYLLSATILFIAILTIANSSWALSVDSVRFGIHPDKTRLVIELDQNSDFKAFVLNNPDRLVIDLPTYNWNAGNIKKPKKSPITDLRTGALNKDISRLVVDLNSPIQIKSAFTLPPSENNKFRLVIDFQKINKSASNTETKRQFGKLDYKKTTTEKPTTNFNAKVVRHDKTSNYNVRSNNSSIVIPKIKPDLTTNSAASAAPFLKKPYIVIDAGHGGQDPGAISKNKVYEKRVTLAAAQELKKQLESSGRYKVSLTRDNDRYIKLYKRVAIARKRGADMFISLHADSIGDKNVRGASIYTLSNKSSDAQTAKLAAKENRSDLIAGVDLTHEDKEVANILIDLAMRDTMNQSKFFANIVVSTLPKHNIRILRKPHRYAGFAVLKAPDIPSVLIEMGFMSNKQDVSLLSSSSYRRKMASALVNSIDKYFQKIRENHAQ